MDEELLQRASIMQKESEEIEKNLSIINEHVSELQVFKENLEFIQKSDEKEILASLGKGVFIKSKIEDDSKLFVEVGAGVVVKKTPEETKKVIESQINKFEEGKRHLLEQLGLYREEFRKMLEQVEKTKR